MFQNAKIARDAGNQRFLELRANGAHQQVAEQDARITEARRLAELDQWTRDNVGLD